MQVAELVKLYGLASESEVEAAEATSRDEADLVTNLIATTTHRVDEATWLAVLADAFKLEAVQPGPLAPPSDAVASMVPRDLLLEYAVVPLVLELDTLVVAVARPLSPDSERTLGESCGRPIWQKVALELRVRQALAANFGATWQSRGEDLLPKLDSALASPASASMFPAPLSAGDGAVQGDIHEWVDRAFEAIERADDRDTVLRVAFSLAHRLFQFSAIFRVSGQLVEGRWAQAGNEDIVSLKGIRLPLPGLSIFAKAAKAGGLVSVLPTSEGIDALLFAQLKHAPQNAIAVAPILVHQRAVAFVLGDPGRSDAPPEALSALAAVIVAAGHRLERVIWKRKLAAKGSNVNGSLPVVADVAPGAPRAGPKGATTRELASLERHGSARAPIPSSGSTPWRWPPLLLVASLIVVLGAGGGGLLARLRSPSTVEPLDMLDEARELSALGPRARLAGLLANVNASGQVQREDPGPPLQFTFVDGLRVVDVRLEPSGLAAFENDSDDLPFCGGAPCVLKTARPVCTMGKLWENALRYGATRRDRAQISLVPSEKGAVWTFTVRDRGVLLIEDATCMRQPRSRIPPPAKPVSAIPGAPRAVDPLATFDLARAQSGLEEDAELNQITIRHVDPSGHSDFYSLNRPGSIEYTFSDPAGEPTIRRRRVTLNSDGVGVAVNAEGIRLPAVQRPRCTVAEVLTRSQVATDDVVVLYEGRAQSNPVEPEWTVRVGTKTLTLLDRECARSGATAPTIVSADAMNSEE